MLNMVDKPGRRKKKHLPWGKIIGIILVALVAVGSGWYIYQNYIYSPSPVYARIDTSLGVIEVELYPACAPQTVSNFVNLVKSGFYDDLVWHRIVPGFVIQTGDPNTKGGLNSTRGSWGKGGSNNTVPLEVTSCSWIGNYAGYLGMARQGNDTSGLNTGTSQFYINLSNSTVNVNLNGYYTAFGKVISGMTVVCAISHVPVYPSSSNLSYQPKNPVFIDNITIISATQAPTPQPMIQCSS
jgi:dolichyl-diphosphooligosaccharide--protein glycosyltransferase